MWYHSSSAILVDEGTSGLDVGLESLIKNGLKELAAAGKVVIAIAHRESFLDQEFEVVKI